MKKPKLPKRWKPDHACLRTGGEHLKLGVFDYGNNGESICLFVGDPPGDVHVSISTSYATAPRFHNKRSTMIRAVEIAAIHAGLVEDRDA